jgi:hypothetical protein
MRSVLPLLFLALPLAFADHKPNVNHRELAKRAKSDAEKRDSNARWTFYETGLSVPFFHYFSTYNLRPQRCLW